MPLAPIENKTLYNGEYTGQLLGEKFHGRGTMKYSDGVVYEGDWQHGYQCGRGKKSGHGMEYEGGMENDQYHGQGHLKCEDYEYKGGFRNGQKHDRGTLTLASGSSYEGGWRYDQKTGYGVYKYSNGDSYEGEWANSQFEGPGFYRYADGNFYRGPFVAGQKSGKGLFYWKASGDVYEGSYANDVSEGPCHQKWGDGCQFEGSSTNDMFHGVGTFTMPNGDKWKGHWENHICKHRSETGDLSEPNQWPQLLQECVEQGKCIASITGRCVVETDYFVCVTCFGDQLEPTESLIGKRGCCATCAQACHQGHELRKETGKFRCTCGFHLGPQPCCVQPPPARLQLLTEDQEKTPEINYDYPDWGFPVPDETTADGLHRYGDAYYLPLRHVGGMFNASRYKCPTRKPWGYDDTDVETLWYKIRIDPATLKVNTGDYRFSRSVGKVSHHGEEFSRRVPYGTCFDCESGRSQEGEGNIDLRGTPFAVDDQFKFDGYAAAGSWTFSENDQVVRLTGGGYCGWTCPKSCASEQDAYTGGEFLQLKRI